MTVASPSGPVGAATAPPPPFAADFALGLFSANCSSGLAVTTVPERWSGSWADNLALARLADDVGIDFMLPIARWIGYGGETNFHEGVLDPTVLAAGLLAHTERLRVFSTVHTAFHHPVVVAKQLATLDQIAPGRAGLNIVAGWNEPEYRAFGIELPTGHDDRYGMAEEWWSIVRRLWSQDGAFDHHGRWFDLTGIESSPKPAAGRLTVLNAGSSPQGRTFAARHADCAFTVVVGPEDGAGVVRTIAEAGREHGRDVGTLTLAHVVCRPTRAEADEALRHYADTHADWAAVDNLMRLQGLHAQSFSPEMLATFRSRFAAGHGSCPLVGTPDEVAAEIVRFRDAGFAGMTLSFLDYTGELEFFAAEVIPRLERAGVRKPR